MFHDNKVVMVGAGSNHVVVLSTESTEEGPVLQLKEAVTNYIAPIPLKETKPKVDRKRKRS